ncbi:unnamed protein product [Mytilus coruscus]|uniref:Uncharacterized protein n=1 Tax=Mytilus coruscus TaxID=42192 RepID=A0A6J8F4I3_MYTCO|nr:unnamed protein product [Mytilus coruscus]
MCVTLTITSNIGSCENKSSVRDCIKLSTTDVEPNSTSCNYKREFPLSEGYAVSVCSNLNEIRIYFTEFVNEGTTIQGFYLNTRQNNTVQHMMLAQTWVLNLMVAGLPDQNQMPELGHVNDPLDRVVSPELVHVQMLLQRAEEQMIQPPPYSETVPPYSETDQQKQQERQEQ